MKWDRVVICDSWGPGAAHSLTPPSGGNLDFRLVPRSIKGARGKQHSSYVVDPSGGSAPDLWAGAIFFEVGTDEVTGISGLPDWDKSKPSAICKAYQKAIDDQTKNNLGKSNTKRLESIIPYVDDSGNLGYNYVRLFYLPKARNAPTAHLFVVTTATAALPKGSVRALQDGAGHGPPS